MSVCGDNYTYTYTYAYTIQTEVKIINQALSGSYHPKIVK